MIRTFKALSALLSYPSTDLQEAISDIREILTFEKILPVEAIVAMEPLLSEFETGDIFDVQERYVLLFDRSRTLSLNLFEHIHGEGRDRGGAMVDLLETYRAQGYDLVATELPDHLPVLLEFIATLPIGEAREMLVDAGHIIAALAERLTRRETPYAAVLTALSDFAQASLETDEAQALISEKDDDPEDLDALDAVYEEAMVTFGPDPNAGCPVSRDILARMDAPLRPATA
ncbi:MAG: nitrate reductase molybdenum cofactor assembly chaperone [Hoeflea sp.]|uniref:nitrate reductase molybdenum cofactor assembly chaperone n=1 Tax=Hoeflea sp. TaxID=1940281 RepID=UPI001DDA63EB|nr:nitrate reductase molybdenum cofactor assembly chaperone [Hoeflea sp.]MBU4530529.1 nitrate reductase molybdenum cofactor assembly chaperone [Alphaproteobacteria bacterium]MBU4545316.1 nitrate reductase molybdenum cofactor assembly chaperone [Alphaproteobacteria bacterium]MBU4548965.1 nitrate reductase molybdenum cofactor assembly chaperone [Alphaproteobacteria bacterium]MBV1722120.1 nitrate reductase molybdenum cofactor assembly chaperone [Hoeflea sp.]MBV1761470.1 nitrate reductase molybden